MDTRSDHRATGRSLNCEINVTPLVDVMLVVLIIFILVTPLLQQGVGVDLPQARNIEGVSEDEDQTLTVALQGNGRMFLGAEPIDPADLTGALQLRRGASPDLQLQVKADRNAPYGEIKRILKAGREAGFHGASLIAREIPITDYTASLASHGPAAQGD